MSSKLWYVVQAYTGAERQVERFILEHAKLKNIEYKFGRILIPTENVVEMRGGQKRRSERKFFPGYVFVEMELDDETWHFVSTLPKVSGFVGVDVDGRPAPIPQKQVDAILHRVEEGVEKPRPKVLFEPGEVVRVIDGPFAEFNGVVEEVNYEKNRLRVAVLIFGRSTPVELEFSQVTKG